MEQFTKAKKIVVLFGFLLLGFILFLATVYRTILAERKLPELQTKKLESAIRGAIYSQDGFLLASSKKLYKARTKQKRRKRKEKNTKNKQKLHETT